MRIALSKLEREIFLDKAFIVVAFLLSFGSLANASTADSATILEERAGAGETAKSGHYVCIRLSLRYAPEVIFTDGAKVIESNHGSARGTLIQLHHTTKPKGLVSSIIDMQEGGYRHVRIPSALAEHEENPKRIPLEAKIQLREVLENAKDSKIRGCKPVPHKAWFAAARTGDLETARAMADIIPNLEIKEEHLKTALALAAENGQLEIVNFLIEQGADPKAVDEFGLSIDELAFYGNENKTGLYKTGADYLEIVAALDPGYSEREQTIRLIRRSYRDTEYTIALLGELDSAEDLTEFLIGATAAKNIDLVRYLLGKGADPLKTEDREGMTVVHIAARSGVLEILKLLVENGGRVNGGEYSPVYGAIEKRHLHIVKYLIENGAENEVTPWWDKQYTMLHLAARYGNADIVAYLLELGHEIDAVDKKGNTPLHVAIQKQECCMGNFPKTVQLLLEGGANPTTANGDGRSVFELAKDPTLTTMLRLHQQAESKVPQK